MFSLLSVSAQIKIAYVTDLSGATSSTYPNDTKILAALKADAISYTVTEVAAAASGVDFSGYDVIIIAEPAPSAGTTVLACKGIAKPVLNMKVFAYKTGTTTWAWVLANTMIVDNPTATSVIVQKPSHPIFTGLGVSKGTELQMVTAVVASGTTTKGVNGVSSYNNVVGVIDTLATIKDATTGQLSVMEIPVGTSVGGTTITKKFIQIGISGAAYANVTPTALTMVKNAITYLTSPVTGIQEAAKTAFTVKRSASSLDVMTDANLTLSLYSSCGQLIGRSLGNSVGIGHLTAGVYVLKMVDSNGATQTYKFIK